MTPMSDAAHTMPMSAPLSPSFDEIVRAHSAWMLALAQRYVKDPALAEDCVQDALWSVHRNLDRFEGRSSLRGWLRSIVVNAALMTLRRRRRHDGRSIDQPYFEEALATGAKEACWSAQPPNSSVETLMRRETRAIVHARLQTLSERHRQIIDLRDLQELSTGEAAARLKISEAAAKVLLHRARAALRRALEPASTDLTY